MARRVTQDDLNLLCHEDKWPSYYPVPWCRAATLPEDIEVERPDGEIVRAKKGQVVALGPDGRPLVYEHHFFHAYYLEFPAPA